MLSHHKLEQEDMYNEYRPDIPSDTPTMTTTSTDSIPTASYTDSIFNMASSNDENSDLKKAIVGSLIVILCSINPVRSYISKLISIPWNAILILSSAFEDNQTEIMADIADDDDEKSFTSEASTGTSHFLNSIRQRLNFLLRLFSCVFEVRFGFRRSAKISDEFEDSVESETEAKGETSTKRLSLLGTKKSKKKIIHNIAMPPESNTDKPIQKQEKVISFNVDSIEPAFLNEESYPEDWMVYDAVQGKLVKRSDLMREKEKAAQAAQPVEAQSIEAQPIESQPIESQ